jgi:hypothetical protein
VSTLLKTKEARPDPAGVYICVEAFATADRVVRLEDELRGADPIVERHFAFFRPAGTPRAEWPSAVDRAVAMGNAQGAEAEKDLVIAIKDVLEPTVVCAAGTRLHKDNEIVKKNRGHFRPLHS